MAAPVRQHGPGAVAPDDGFVGGVRFIASWLRDEWVAWRAGANFIEDAQLDAAATVRNGRIAHNRGRFERAIDLSFAPFGADTWVPDRDAPDNERYSMPALAFVAGQMSFRMDGRIDRTTLFVESLVGIRDAANAPGVQAHLDWDGQSRGKFFDYETAEVTVELRLVRADDSFEPEFMDDNQYLGSIVNETPGTRAPADPDGNSTLYYCAHFKGSPQNSSLPGLLIAGPIRISTRRDQKPDPLAKPGVTNEIPLGLSEFKTGDRVVAIVRTPRIANVFLGTPLAPWLAAGPFFGDGAFDYRNYEAAHVGAARLSLECSYEAQP